MSPAEMGRLKGGLAEGSENMSHSRGYLSIESKGVRCCQAWSNAPGGAGLDRAASGLCCHAHRVRPHRCASTRPGT